MFSTRSAVAILGAVLLIPIARAQSRPEAEAAAQAEQRKLRVERDKKAFTVVEEILKETQSLKLPENRIRIQIALADLLWQRDEAQARSLFKDAATSLSEVGSVSSESPEFYKLTQLASQLRQEILQVVAKHDARLAIDFLRSTRPSDTQSPGYASTEAQLEIRLASEVAGKDVNEALRIAEESLKKGIDYEAINLLYKLYSPDKAPAEKFLTAILQRLRTEDYAKNPTSWYVALTLFRTWSENNHLPEQGRQRTTFNISLPNLNEQAARGLSSSIIGAVIDNGPGGSPQLYAFSGHNSGNLQQIKALLPDFERLSPTQGAALRKKVKESDNIIELQQGPWAKYRELIERGTSEDLMEASKTAPAGFSDHLKQQAAWKALNQGDTDTARQLVDKIEDVRQRREATLNIDRQLANRASEQGSLAEARAALSRIPVVEERVGLLAQLATRVLAKDERAAAIQLLGDGLSLIGERARNYQQLRAQLQIARAYEQLDGLKSSSIVETVIERINELSDAAVILDGFDLQQYFREGEFVINSGNSMCQLTQEVAGELRSIASKDIERARSAAARFDRGEMRAMAFLEIVRGTVTPEDPEDGEQR